MLFFSCHADFEKKFKKEFFLNSIPEHQAILADVFISKKPVTCTDFESFIIDSKYTTDAEVEGWGWVWEKNWQKREGVNWHAPFGDENDKLYKGNSETFPVMQVSWNDAFEFCKWLTIKSQKKIRLPHEYEWELFSGLNGGSSLENIDAGKTEFLEKDELIFPGILNEISCKSSSVLTGLIWEWTMDWFESYPGGEYNKEYGHVYKVLKGGSYLSYPLQKTKEYRFRRCPTARSPFYGFRIAIENSV